MKYNIKGCSDFHMILTVDDKPQKILTSVSITKKDLSNYRRQKQLQIGHIQIPIIMKFTKFGIQEGNQSL
jgi:hypothetical protein